MIQLVRSECTPTNVALVAIVVAPAPHCCPISRLGHAGLVERDDARRSKPAGRYPSCPASRCAFERFRSSATLRLRLSVMASTTNKVPPGPCPRTAPPRTPAALELTRAAWIARLIVSGGPSVAPLASLTALRAAELARSPDRLRAQSRHDLADRLLNSLPAPHPSRPSCGLMVAHLE